MAASRRARGAELLFNCCDANLRVCKTWFNSHFKSAWTSSVQTSVPNLLGDFDDGVRFFAVMRIVFQHPSAKESWRAAAANADLEPKTGHEVL